MRRSPAPCGVTRWTPALSHACRAPPPPAAPPRARCRGRSRAARRASGPAPGPGRCPRTTRTPLVVTAPPVSLATTRCRSAKAATCGRWVTTSTWWLRASRASRRPISTAARPPTPASTSSKTSVGGPPAPAKTTSIASMTRDSSPPEAPLLQRQRRRARVGDAAAAPPRPRRRADPRSTPSTASVGLAAGRPGAATATSTRACGIASPASSSLTAAGEPLGRRPPGRGQPRGQRGHLTGQPRLLRLQLRQPLSSRSSSASRCRARSAHAITPSTSSAYLRVSARSAARRS